MNLPLLIKQLYGEITLTGLYSLEFFHENKSVCEFFFVMPPTKKSVTEKTRSSTVATLGGNYTNDAGNSTKQISLNGKIYFPIVGNTQNPLFTGIVDESDSSSGQNIDGLTYFFALRWMLIRYRDYTMTKNCKMTIPIAAMSASKEVAALYKKVSKLMSKKAGALSDQIRMVIHDYDMDDHFYCRVISFMSEENSTAFSTTEYSIEFDGYERYAKSSSKPIVIKTSERNSIEMSAGMIDTETFDSLIAGTFFPSTAS